MTHHETRILAYLKQFPDVRSKYVAGIFGVSVTTVDVLRRKHGAHRPRKAAALARNIKAAELDKQILDAVYRRGLVDVVLGS